MNNINKTDILQLYQFGPVLAKYKLEDNFVEELYLRGNKTHKDYSSQLAGHIKKENQFDLKDRQWFLNNTNEIFLKYLEVLKLRSLKNKNVSKLELTSLWINFMKNGEFNPIHDHSGDISFVIYVAVPDELIKEKHEFKGKGVGPGTISFLYGEESNSYTSHYNFFPQKGIMFIFPAKLRHFVPPFQSKVIRISVSGNLRFIYN